MAFMGELSDVGVADLLYLLGVRQLTGKLTINANADEVNLFLAGGNLVLVTSTNLALRLGRTLLRLGMLSSAQLRDALQEQDTVGFGRPLGSILLARGWISSEQLGACVEEQCIDVLARVIATEHGTFIYSSGVRAPHRTEVVPLNSDRVLVEATKRTDELRTLRGLLPTATAPLSLAPEIDDLAETLTDAEVLVAATLLSGATSLHELAHKVAMDELALWRTIISLRERGLVIATPIDLAAADAPDDTAAVDGDPSPPTAAGAPPSPEDVDLA